MLQPVRKTVMLSGGALTLHAWGADAVEAHTLDLLTLTLTLGAMREDWQEFSEADVEARVWVCFWRLVQASAPANMLTAPLSWADRLTVLEVMWDLNEVEVGVPKLTALVGRAQVMLSKLSQGQTTI